jgi:hypothetical protein
MRETGKKPPEDENAYIAAVYGNAKRYYDGLESHTRLGIKGKSQEVLQAVVHALENHIQSLRLALFSELTGGKSTLTREQKDKIGELIGLYVKLKDLYESELPSKPLEKKT